MSGIGAWATREACRAAAVWVGALSAVMSVTGLFGQLYFGRMMDLRGTKWVLVVSGLVIPFLPWAWMLAGEPWHVIPINAMAGLMWAGYNLAGLNMVLLLSPDDRRPSYAAAFQTCVFFSAFVGPLIGGPLSQSFGFRLIFFISGAGRLVSTLLLMRFVHEVRPEAHA